MNIPGWQRFPDLFACVWECFGYTCTATTQHRPLSNASFNRKLITTGAFKIAPYDIPR